MAANTYTTSTEAVAAYKADWNKYLTDFYALRNNQQKEQAMALAAPDLAKYLSAVNPTTTTSATTAASASTGATAIPSSATSAFKSGYGKYAELADMFNPVTGKYATLQRNKMLTTARSNVPYGLRGTTIPTALSANVERELTESSAQQYKDVLTQWANYTGQYQPYTQQAQIAANIYGIDVGAKTATEQIAQQKYATNVGAETAESQIAQQKYATDVQAETAAAQLAQQKAEAKVRPTRYVQWGGEWKLQVQNAMGQWSFV